ncbi:amidase signature domain-containing protein [Immersiella caudata]|uniref:Amidase signature domain-containing protein n=1 Tax=Immersiella caudata TaxID=314043 RepID=A0AA40C6R4_9PEZI|nr:amidase signature domain-containing protein [Immersiella caudata]
MSLNQKVNLLAATARNLRRLLDAGEVTSAGLVQLHLAQIAARNLAGMKLNAIIATTPTEKVMEEAKASGNERRTSGPRSKLHGIPTILKTPAGSSSGPAAAAAAGFAPLCIGTEADVSIVQPAIRAALYSMKCTAGAVNMAGTQSSGAAWDSAGPMAKSVEDCVDVMHILLPGRNFRSSLKRSWQGIRIALLNYEEWQWDDETCARASEYDDQHELSIGTNSGS